MHGSSISCAEIGVRRMMSLSSLIAVVGLLWVIPQDISMSDLHFLVHCP